MMTQISAERRFPLIGGHPRSGRRCPLICADPRQGQATVEYAILVGVAVAAILGMQVYAKRGIQAVVKVSADMMTPFTVAADTNGKLAQVAGILYESGDRNLAVIATGGVLDRRSATQTTSTTHSDTTTAGNGAVTRAIPTDKSDTTGAVSGVGAGVSSYSEVIASVR